MTGDGAPIRRGQVLLTGSALSREESLIPLGSGDDGNQASEDIKVDLDPDFLERSSFKGHGDASRIPSSTDELACWNPFLHLIYETTAASLCEYHSPNVRIPAIRFQERSWDFQPVDVIRPLAKTNLSDIAVIARRMGMKWKDFRPSDGILRAEGHSHIITSTVVRSLGIVLQYSNTGQGNRLRSAEEKFGRNLITGSVINEQPENYIPRARADRLGCGVIRSDRQLGLPDFTISTQGEIVNALSFLDGSGTSSANLSRILKENPEFQFRIADLVAFTTLKIRSHGSDLVQVPAPSDNVRGVTTSSIGRRAFRECLEEYIVVHHHDVGDRTREAFQICKDIGSKFATWDSTGENGFEGEQWVVRRDIKYLDAVQDYLWPLTEVLYDMEHQNQHFRYLKLLGIHIRIAMFCEDGETSLSRSWGTDYKADVVGYFQQLPKIVDEMRKTGFYDRQLIVDAWVTMMLRAMCWGALHFFVPGERVPIQYFGSQLPVYIG